MQSWASGVLGSVSVDLAWYMCSAKYTHCVQSWGYYGEVMWYNTVSIARQSSGLFPIWFWINFLVIECSVMFSCCQMFSASILRSSGVLQCCYHISSPLQAAEQTEKQKANCQNWLPATMSKSMWSCLVKPTSIWMGYALMHLCSDISFVF